MTDEDEKTGTRLGADPLHRTDKFASRHFKRGIVILIGLAAVVFAHTFLNCAGS